MSELISWLRATIEADKAAAEAATGGPWEIDVTRGDYGETVIVVQDREATVIGPGYEGGGVWERKDADHILLQQPRDTIARCEAELFILSCHEGSHECASPDDNCLWIEHEDDCPTLKALARGRRHRPGFNPAWLDA